MRNARTHLTLGGALVAAAAVPALAVASPASARSLRFVGLHACYNVHSYPTLKLVGGPPNTRFNLDLRVTTYKSMGGSIAVSNTFNRHGVARPRVEFVSDGNEFVPQPGWGPVRFSLQFEYTRNIRWKTITLGRKIRLTTDEVAVGATDKHGKTPISVSDPMFAGKKLYAFETNSTGTKVLGHGGYLGRGNVCGYARRKFTIDARTGGHYRFYVNAGPRFRKRHALFQSVKW